MSRAERDGRRVLQAPLRPVLPRQYPYRNHLSRYPPALSYPSTHARSQTRRVRDHQDQRLVLAWREPGISPSASGVIAATVAYGKDSRKCLYACFEQVGMLRQTYNGMHDTVMPIPSPSVSSPAAAPQYPPALPHSPRCTCPHSPPRY